MLGLAEFEDGVGPCGWHKSLTGDKSNHFTFEDETCPVCAATERWSRIQAERDAEWHKRNGGDDLPASKPRPSDGRQTFSRLMSPDEVARRASGSG